MNSANYTCSSQQTKNAKRVACCCKKYTQKYTGLSQLQFHSYFLCTCIFDYTQPPRFMPIFPFSLLCFVAFCWPLRVFSSSALCVYSVICKFVLFASLWALFFLCLVRRNYCLFLCIIQPAPQCFC